MVVCEKLYSGCTFKLLFAESILFDFNIIVGFCKIYSEQSYHVVLKLHTITLSVDFFTSSPLMQSVTITS